MTITTQTPRASTIDTVQQEMPTQSEENNQHRYDALGGRDADALLSSIHQGDRQERDRRVWRSMIFIASTGLAMIVAATFATVLELSDFWQTLWLAICIVFTLLFFVGCFASARNLVEKLVTSFVRWYHWIGFEMSFEKEFLPADRVLGVGVRGIHRPPAEIAKDGGWA